MFGSLQQVEQAENDNYDYDNAELANFFSHFGPIKIENKDTSFSEISLILAKLSELQRFCQDLYRTQLAWPSCS